MDFALFDLALVAEIINESKNQNTYQNQVKYNLTLNDFHPLARGF
jgi:hypothetical protein